ncbi:hypothetical protein LTR37_003336 [Vermiconidia calcicola]|uniref:Uncharacterized protein n=1 Tax=Vermiconidia calcicola TaxID=1690605 RepID=A0ACC3NQF0_9PEZI|nr:hypothetical protein LTR37_003336 [Vermiconidia calcicola]
MPYWSSPVDLQGILQLQRSYHIAELGHTHKALSKEYNKLARIECAISERKERQLTRKEKKRLQWSRALAKKAVHSLELQQAWLEEYLRQCSDLLTAYNGDTYSTPATPWTTHLPPASYPTSPYYSSPTTSWTAQLCSDDQETQYWDLSMPGERRASSAHAPSADSGFHEPVLFGQPFPLNETEDTTQVYDQDPTTAQHDDTGTQICFMSKRSSTSENDHVPELWTPSSPTRTDKEPTTPRKRRYSENAIRLIENRLSLPKFLHRGQSVDHIPAMSRTRSGDPAVGTDNVAEYR